MFFIATMAESKKRHSLVNISRSSLKSYSSHLNNDLKPYAKYKNPSLSGSQDIVLTSFFSIAIMTESKKEHNLIHRIRTKINQGIYTLIFSQMPNIRILVQGVSIAIMAESKNGHNLVNISRNSLKS